MHVTKDIDLVLLQQELDSAGVPVPGLNLTPNETGADLLTYAPGEHGILMPSELPPEAEAVVAAHDASKPKRTAAFEQQEDADRLALVNQRAQVDPAFAALSELVLRPKG